MDTSETYIKMCERAVEIQKGKPELEDTDYVYCYYCKKIHLAYHMENDNVWLPRQDQLQEMLGKNDLNNLESAFHEWRHWNFLNGYQKFTSMEQLWLGFVIKDKYNKVWDGDDWIEEK